MRRDKEADRKKRPLSQSMGPGLSLPSHTQRDSDLMSEPGATSAGRAFHIQENVSSRK
jgi:hypothetical protein